MTPEIVLPDFENMNPTLESSGRSFVQAWFVGAHIDMGGSAKQDGLSLYPLQWMLLESAHYGLCLQFEGSFEGRAKIDDPLSVVFPRSTVLRTLDDSWKCTTENGIITSMEDLQNVHGAHLERYSIKLNRVRILPYYLLHRY